MCIDSSDAFVCSGYKQFALHNLLDCQNDAILDFDTDSSAAGTEAVVSLRFDTTQKNS